MQMWEHCLTYFKQDQMHGLLFLQKYRKHLYLPSGIGERLLQGSIGPESTNLIVVPAQRWATTHPKLQFTRLLLSIQHRSAEAECKLKQNKNQGIAQWASTCLACTGALGSCTTKWGENPIIIKNAKMQLSGTFSHFILFQGIWKQAAQVCHIAIISIQLSPPILLGAIHRQLPSTLGRTGLCG